MRFLRRVRDAGRKVIRLSRSGLTAFDRFWYVIDEILERTGLLVAGPRVYRLTDGSTIYLRPRTTDSKVFEEVFVDRIYEPFVDALPDTFEPRILVDLGANIGLSSLFLNQRLAFERIVAVEPDAENLKLLRRNLESNLDIACESIQAFAGAGHGFASVLDPGYGAWGLRMGEPSEHGIPVLPLPEIVPYAPGGVLLKCDVEGAEQFFFPHIADWDDLVSFIVLELHLEFFSLDELNTALQTSRYEWRLHGSVEPGSVLAVLALERGARRSTLQSGSDSRNHSRGAAAV